MAPKAGCSYQPFVPSHMYGNEIPKLRGQTIWVIENDPVIHSGLFEYFPLTWWKAGLLLLKEEQRCQLSTETSIGKVERVHCTHSSQCSEIFLSTTYWNFPTNILSIIIITFSSPTSKLSISRPKSFLACSLSVLSDSKIFAIDVALSWRGLELTFNTILDVSGLYKINQHFSSHSFHFSTIFHYLLFNLVRSHIIFVLSN